MTVRWNGRIEPQLLEVLNRRIHIDGFERLPRNPKPRYRVVVRTRNMQLPGWDPGVISRRCGEDPTALALIDATVSGHVLQRHHEGVHQ